MKDMITSFDKMPLGMYEKILDICFKQEDDTDDVARLDTQVDIVSILTGMSRKEILALPLPEYRAMTEKAEFLYDDLLSIKAPKLADKYTIGNYTLVPVTDYRKLITSQYIDFNTYASSKHGKYGDIVGLLSVILVPEGKVYNEGYDIFDLQRVLRTSMPVKTAMEISNFFVTSCRKSIASFLSSSRKEALRLGKKDKKLKGELLERIAMTEKALSKSGDGSTT